MSHAVSMIDSNDIQSRIFTIRGLQVMVDRDLAGLYGVESKRLNEQVKRNIARFPEQFRFQLTSEELENLKSQIATLGNDSLRSQIATLEGGRGKHRKFIANNAAIFGRLDAIEQKQRITDSKLDKVFEAIEAKDLKPTQDRNPGPVPILGSFGVIGRQGEARVAEAAIQWSS